jgi:DNA-binding NarL/FixJ family response regulator
VRVIVTAREALVRSGLEALLGEAGFEVVSLGEADPLGGVADDLAADVAVVDLGWAGADVGALVEVAGRGPTIALVTPESIAEALAAGVAGAISREVRGETLEAAVIAVAAGLRVLDETIEAAGDRGAMWPLRLAAPGSPDYEALTAREVEVLRLVAAGMANKEIGRALSISDNTVKFHVNAVLTKLGARSRTEAAMIGARLGLVSV